MAGFRKASEYLISNLWEQNSWNFYSGSTEYAKDSNKWSQEKEWYRLRVSFVVYKPDKGH